MPSHLPSASWRELILGGPWLKCQTTTRDKFSTLIYSVKTETGTVTKTRPNPHLPRVLLVEDEEPIRDIIVPWLSRDGFDCREAADGQAAMDLLASGTRINLVLSNLLLPSVGCEIRQWTSAAIDRQRHALE